MDLGKFIVVQREQQSLSQRALAKKAGIRQATLSSIESGGEVKLATARSVLRVLGLDLGVVPLRTVSKRTATTREIEIQRLRNHVFKRRQKLRSMIGTMTGREMHRVIAINQETNTGYLAQLWDEFLQLDRSAMQTALDAERFKGMAWQSLLQANPFIVARVGSWA